MNTYASVGRLAVYLAFCECQVPSVSCGTPATYVDMTCRGKAAPPLSVSVYTAMVVPGRV